jgi:hypothetical protein
VVPASPAGRITPFRGLRAAVGVIYFGSLDHRVYALRA